MSYAVARCKELAVDVSYKLSLWLSSNGATHQVNMDLGVPEDRIIHSILVNGKVVQCSGSDVSLYVVTVDELNGHELVVIMKAGDNVLKTSHYNTNSWNAVGGDRFVLSTVESIVRDLSVFSREFAEFLGARGAAASIANLVNHKMDKFNITVDPVHTGGVVAAPGGAAAFENLSDDWSPPPEPRKRTRGGGHAVRLCTAKCTRSDLP